MQQLANVATSDAYSDRATLGPVPTAQQLVYVVANSSAYMQLAPLSASGTQEDWLPEILVPPTSNVIARVSGARWRSAVPGSPAQIVAQLIQPDDPAPGAGTPFTSTLATSGAVGSGVQIPEVTLAQWPPATPTEQQTVVLILPASFDPVGGKPVRWLCHYDLANGIWHVMGPPLIAVINTTEQYALAVYGDAPTAGPSITIPRAGDYQITTECSISDNNNTFDNFASPSIAAGVPADSDGADSATGALLRYQSVIKTVEKTGLATNAVVKTQYKRETNNGFFMQIRSRVLRALPLRIT